MVKYIHATTIAALICAGLAIPAAAQQLNITAWGGTSQDAQRKVYFVPYTEKTGVKIHEDTWNGGFGIIEAKVKAGNPNWDIVQVEADELELGCADGLYEKLNWDRLGKKSEWLPIAVSDCGVGTNIWATMIGYDGDKIADGPKSWADFWDMKKYPGKRGMRKGAKMTLEFALLADGVPLGEIYEVLRSPNGVDRAFKKLDEIKANTIWWESGAQVVQLLASGEVTMSMAYWTRLDAFNKAENRNLKVVWNGSTYSTDYWVILKGARDPKAAMDFIAFASQPEIMMKLAEVLPSQGLPNKAASAMLPADIVSQSPSLGNIKDAFATDASFWLDHGEEISKRFASWLAY